VSLLLQGGPDGAFAVFVLFNDAFRCSVVNLFLQLPGSGWPDGENLQIQTE
jgi:hypothetical protein